MNAYELADDLEQAANLEMELGRPENWADLKTAADMLRQLATEKAELEKDFAWAKDQWNKDRICFESRINELEKDLALKTRDRDVFSNFTLAYEDRIAELEKGGCGNCHACLVGVMENGYPVTMQRMIVCPDCGNKRCPKASNHRHKCTGSNEVGQYGSIYTAPRELSDEEINRLAMQNLKRTLNERD